MAKPTTTTDGISKNPASPGSIRARSDSAAGPTFGSGVAEPRQPTETLGWNGNDRDAIARYEYQRQASLFRDRVRDVAQKTHTSAYIFGRSGNGKTRLARQTLDDIGESYRYAAGHLTPMGFFDLLRKYCDEVILIDDCTRLFRDQIGQQLLLAALGSGHGPDRARIVSYYRRNRCEQVNFTGGLIAISNLRLHESDVFDAIKSRTRPLSWDPTEAQLIALIRDAVSNGWDTNGTRLTTQECHEVLNFLVSESRRYNVEIDLRLFFDGALADFAASKSGWHEADWRDHVVMAIRERVGRLEHSGAPLTRDALKRLEQKIAQKIRASYNTRAEQVEAWKRETEKSERAFDRRTADLRTAE